MISQIVIIESRNKSIHRTVNAANNTRECSASRSRARSKAILEGPKSGQGKRAWLNHRQGGANAEIKIKSAILGFLAGNPCRFTSAGAILRRQTARPHAAAAGDGEKSQSQPQPPQPCQSLSVSGEAGSCPVSAMSHPSRLAGARRAGRLAMDGPACCTNLFGNDRSPGLRPFRPLCALAAC